MVVIPNWRKPFLLLKYVNPGFTLYYGFRFRSGAPANADHCQHPPEGWTVQWQQVYGAQRRGRVVLSEGGCARPDLPHRWTQQGLQHGRSGYCRADGEITCDVFTKKVNKYCFRKKYIYIVQKLNLIQLVLQLQLRFSILKNLLNNKFK